MWFKILFLFTCFITVHGLLYELGLNNILSLLLSKPTTWQPQSNPVFAGIDTDDIGKKFLGIKLDRQPKIDQQPWSPPDADLLGRGPFGTGKGLYNNDDRYRKDYWLFGSNKKLTEVVGNTVDSLGNTVGSLGNTVGKVLGTSGNGILSNVPSRLIRNVQEDENEHERIKRGALPTNFDWRDYTDCESLHDIRYQECGDCWAVASASVMSDRYCLFTKKNKYFAARQVVSCVYPKEGGCDGGYPTDAMSFYKSNGVASGGDPTIKDEPKGCLPYYDNMNKSLACPKVCDSKSALDSTKAQSYRQILSKNATEIAEEIYKYGPVVSVMEVFDDLGYMGKGVYQHINGKSQGYHSVRIIGFGVDKSVPYWLVANSWGKDWGDKGYFKILRGKNHCNVESWITTVYPVEAYKK